MKSFEKIIIEKGEKYFGRFYPLLLENNMFLRNKYRSILDKVGLDKNGCILDLGCGTGVYLSFLKDYGRIVYGVDKNYVLTKEAAMVLEKRDGIKILVSEAERLPFHHEVFDLVFINDSLIHFDNQEKAIMQIKNVLKKSGKVIFVEPNIINPIMMLTLLFFKDGLRIFNRNKIKTCKKLSQCFIIDKICSFNLIYTNSNWKISLFNLFDKITSFYLLSIFSLRYIVIARKGND